jgi:hypothetical protein
LEHRNPCKGDPIDLFLDALNLLEVQDVVGDPDDGSNDDNREWEEFCHIFRGAVENELENELREEFNAQENTLFEFLARVRPLRSCPGHFVLS